MVQVRQLNPHLHPQHGIKVRQRLIKQEHLGVADQGAPDGNPLPLTTRQQRRAAVEQAFQMQRPPDLGGAGQPVGLFHPLHFQRKGDVFGHRHMGVKRIGLEHHGDLAIRRGHVGDIAAIDADGAGAGILQPGNQPQQGGFAAARGAEQGAELALFHRQFNVADRLKRPEILGQVAEFDMGHRRYSLSHSCIGLAPRLHQM